MNPNFLIGLPPGLPISPESGIVDSQLKALHIPRLAELLKVKFAEPSRKFQEFYDHFKFVVPYSCHKKESQESMREERLVKELSTKSNLLTSSINISSLTNTKQYCCTAEEAVRMVEIMCTSMNKAETDHAAHINMEHQLYAPIAGKSILFLTNNMHHVLEKWRSKCLAQYAKASIIIQKKQRMIHHYRKYRVILAAAIRIQTRYRTRKARIMFLHALDKCSYVKFKLLMFVHRKKYRRHKSAINLIKGWMKHRMQNIRMLLLLDKLHQFHSLARASLMKQKTLTVLRSISMIQSKAKLFLFRCRYKAKRILCSIKCQCTFRGWYTRKVNIAIVTRIQNGAERRKKNKCAAKLQAVHRGAAVRSRKYIVDSSIRIIQKWSRYLKDRFDYLKVRFLTLWLQKQIRYIIANNRINRMLERKMLQDAARQIAKFKHKEFICASDYGLEGLCIGSQPNPNGHTFTSLDFFFLDIL